MQDRDIRRDARLAWLVTLGVLAINLALAQHSYWGDGRRLLESVDVGLWRYHHSSFLPTGQLFRFLAQPFPGMNTERAMVLFVAASVAGGVGFLTRAASLLGAPPLAAAFGGLLTAVTPTVFFYGTSIEVHAPQFFYACLAIYGYAKWRQSGKLPDAFMLSLFFLGMIASHLSSAIWAPAFLFQALWGSGKLRLPTRILPAILLLGAAYLAWSAINPEGSPAPSLLSSSMQVIFKVFRSDYVLSEFLAKGACLFVLPTVLLFRTKLELHTTILVSLLLLLPVAIFQTLHIEEQGAYFITAFAVLGLLSALGLARLGRAALPIALVLLTVQGYLSRQMVWHWQNEFPGSEWSIPMVEECNDNGLLLALENWEAHSVRYHSHLISVSLRTKKAHKVLETPLDSEQARSAMLAFIESCLKPDGRLTVTQSLVEYGQAKPSISLLLDQIAAKYGAPQPGKHAGYVIYPAIPPSE